MQETSNMSIQRRWLVMVAVHFIQFLEMGILKSYAVLLPDITRDLGTSTAMIGTAIGLSHGISFILVFAGPLLLRHFYARTLVIIGSSLASSGFMMSAFVSSGPQFLIVLFLIGLAQSLMVITVMACPLLYLPQNYVVANSFAISGSGLGMMIIPAVMDNLAMIYGWRGAILIAGAVNLHCVAFSALMRPITSCPADQHLSHIRRREYNSPKIAQSRECVELTQQTTDEPGEPSTRSRVNEFLDILESIFNFRLFIIRPMIIFAYFSFFLTGIPLVGWFVFVMPNAIDKGHSPSRAALLATIGGAANVLGRLLIGFYTKLNITSHSSTQAILHLLCGACFFTYQFKSTFPFLSMLSFGNGFTLGALLVAKYNIITEIADEKLRMVAINYCIITQGLGEIVGGHLVGKLFDLIKSFDKAFVVVGAIDIVALVSVMLPVWVQYCRDRSRDRQPDGST